MYRWMELLCCLQHTVLLLVMCVIGMPSAPFTARHLVGAAVTLHLPSLHPVFQVYSSCMRGTVPVSQFHKTAAE